MSCPFGFVGKNPHVCESDSDQDDAPAGDANAAVTKDKIKKQKPSGCPMASAASADPRFDYAKDPVSWFYQNQIKSEEEFQAKREQLRTTARQQLDEIFEKKGKHLIIDSDDDDFSICSSEISAWDSDVYSINTLASCANSWAAEAKFTAPALSTLRAVLLATLAAAAYTGWQSLQSMLAINRYWGIVVFGWLPAASLAAALAAAATATGGWYLSEVRSKPGLLGAQLVMHVLCAVCTGLGMLCWVYPSRVDGELKASVCSDSGLAPSTIRLCQYLPLIQEQISLAMATLMASNALLAALALAAACAGTWNLWEVSFIEKKAAKHKRRRRHRKHSIPWDKIKVEEMGPVSYCGGVPPRGAVPPAAAAKAAAVTAAEAAAAAVPGEAKKTV